MPITKVPVVHNFCVSSRPEALQRLRLERLKEINQEKSTKLSRNTTTSCPVITLDFIEKYNSSTDVDKERLNGVLKRVLEHAKYKSCSFKTPAPSSPSTVAETVQPQSPAAASAVTAGWLSGDESQDPDVSEGWLELIALCQCCGTLQQESLSTLATSLQYSPLSPSHIPALFYMAGIGYHWIKDGSIFSMEFRTGELLLLQVLYCVSLRLYLHHLTGVLQNLCSRHAIQQLKFDLQGLENRGKFYEDFPEALLRWKVTLEVGLLICQKYDTPPDVRITSGTASVVNNEPATSVIHNKTADETCTRDDSATPKATTDTSASGVNASSSSCPTASSTNNTDHGIASILWHALDIWQCSIRGFDTLQEAIEDLLTCSTDFNTEPCLEGILAINVLCDAAQCNPTVLRFVQALASGFSGVAAATDDNDTETDLDKQTPIPPSYPNDSTGYPNKTATLNVLGMQPRFQEPDVVSEASQEEDEEEEEEESQSKEEEQETIDGDDSLTANTQALLDTESIPDTLATPHSTEPSSNFFSGTINSLDYSSTNKDSSGIVFISKPDLSQEEEETSNEADKEERLTTNKRVTLGAAIEVNLSEASDEDRVTSSASSCINRVDLLDDRFQFMKTNSTKSAPKSVTLTLPPPRNLDSQCTHYTHSTAPFSFGAGILGSHMAPSTLYQRSVLSTPSTMKTDLSSDSVVSQSAGGFVTWAWEVQFAFVLNMADVVLYGRDSALQASALMGDGMKGSMYNLIELASYNDQLPGLKVTDTHSWKIRYCALQGLTRLVQLCREVSIRDGFRTVAWNVIQARQKDEQQPKALDAYKIQQLYPSPLKSLFDTPATSLSPSPSLIGSIAQQLSSSFLPPPVPTVIASKSTKRPPKTVSIKPHTTPSPSFKQVTAKVTKDVIAPVTDDRPIGYIARTSNALNRIAKRHWEEQMRKENEEEQLLMKEQERQEQAAEKEKQRKKIEKLSRNKRKS